MRKIWIILAIVYGAQGWANGDRFQTILDTLAVTDPALKRVLEDLAQERYADISNFCDGRLTMSSGDPFEVETYYTDDPTLYFTPFVGSRVGIYNGSRWVIVPFTEISITPTLTASKVYDVFVYDNSGTLTLEFSAPWTTDTARADALTKVAGVYVKSSNTTRRYVGTVRTNINGRFDDNADERHVWNYCNQRRRFLSEFNTTAYSYNGPYQFYNGSATGSTITMVLGQPTEVQIECEFQRYPYSATTYGGFGLNSTSTPVHQTSSTEGDFTTTGVAATMQLGIGFQTLNMINSTNSTGTMDVFLQKLQGWIEH